MKSNTTNSEFNFGKQKAIAERVRGYVQTVAWILQFGMMTALTIKSFNLGWYWLGSLGVIGIIAGLLFVKFMRFDIKRNLPAELGWLFSINPEFQALREDVREIKEKLEEILRKTE